MKNKIQIILNYLDELFPNAYCELNYKKDYELLIATMLSAQTTDIKVNNVTSKLFDKYKSLESLSSANIDDLKLIIREIGTYNKKAIYIKEIAYNLLKIGYVPNDRQLLEKLPGVGRKTVNVVLSNLYNEPYLAVDTHVSRVSKRLLLVDENDDPLKIEMKLIKLIPKNKILKLHHQLIFFGRYHCKSIKPNCKNCKLKEICIYEKKNT